MLSKKTKYSLLLILSLSLLQFSITGCSQKNNKKDNTLEQTDNYTEVGTYPVVKNPIKLTVFAPLRPSVSSYEYDKNTFTKYFTDTTGIEFDWQTSTESDSVAKRNAMLTSGTYPEVFLNGYFSPSELFLYGKQGIFIPLNDLIDKYAPNIKKRLDENPLIKDAITSPDGNIYTLSRMGSNFHVSAPYKMWINQVWLDNLGLDMPTTTEEFYEVLKAFKEKDPNGNGIADEIPLSGSANGWNTNPNLFIMNAFVPYTGGTAKTMFLDNGTLHKAEYEDEYKEGLKYLNTLYSEGLLDNLSYSQNNDQLKKIGTNPDISILGCYAGSSVSVAMDMSQNRWNDYVAIPALKGPNGEQNIGYMPYFGDNVLSITDKCKNPIAVIRAWDLLFSGDLMPVMWSVCGEKDIDYKDAASTDVNYEGKPAKFDSITEPDERDGRTWNQLGPFYKPDEYTGYWACHPGGFDGFLEIETQNKYLPYKPNEEDIIPVFALDEDDSKTIIDIEQTMQNFITEQSMSFIMGDKDIDSEWDDYKKELKNIGVETYLKIHQNLYDKK